MFLMSFTLLARLLASQETTTVRVTLAVPASCYATESGSDPREATKLPLGLSVMSVMWGQIFQNIKFLSVSLFTEELNLLYSKKTTRYLYHSSEVLPSLFAIQFET